MNTLDIRWTHLEQVLNDLGNAVIAKARENLDANDSNCTHNLYDTMDKIVNLPDDNGRFVLSISLAEYWEFLEFGTGEQHVPDARGAYWPKIEPIKNWVMNKPGVPHVESFAFAVRGAIRYGTAEHPPGTKPHPFFWSAVNEVVPQYEPLIDQAIADDIDSWLEEAVLRQMEKTFGGK